VGAQKVTVSIV